VNFSKSILVGVVGLALQGVASAQIYQSRDTEGVPEFSDTSSPGSAEVDLGAINIGDPLQTTPEADPQESRAATAGQPQAVEQGQQGEAAYYGDAVDDRGLRAAAYEGELGRERPGEHRPAAEPVQLNSRSPALDQAEMAQSHGRSEPRPLPEARVHRGLKVRH